MLILLKNGLVYNGSLDKPIKQDVLIENNIIKKIGKDIKGKFDRIIDCNGLNIAPGFIDAHSHNDFFVTRSDSSTCIAPFIKQGITTQVVGNCGFSLIGANDKSEYRNLYGGGLFHSDKYYSLQEFVDEYQNKLDCNVIPLVGHGTARISVSGYKSSELTLQEETDMLELLENDMKAGAFGGSLGLMYEPGMYSMKKELTRFAKIIKAYDGILTIHPRACSNVSNGFPLLKRHHLELGLDEFVEILKESKVRGEYSHLIFTGEKSWPRVNSMLTKFHELKNLGFEIGYDMYSYTYGASVITVLLPPSYMALPKEKRSKGLPLFKTKFLMRITKMILGLGFEDMTIAYIGEGYEKYEGRILSDIAKEEGLSNVDMYLKLVNLSDGQGRIYLDKYYNDEIIKRLMNDDMSVFMTDAWYEDKGIQNASTYSCFPHFFELAEKYNIPKENIINKMTGKICDRFRVLNRGYIKEGYFADITIFDHFKVNEATKSAEGLKYVLINGQVVIDNNKYNENKCGVIILKK